jgi:ApaG protein
MAGTSLQERQGISARVESINYAPELDAPADRPFAFVYSLEVRNDSDTPITIKARKWVIKETASGRCHVIEGDGLTGRFPQVAPGEAFRCECYHVVAADSVVEGSLLACDARGAKLLVRVPACALHISA